MNDVDWELLFRYLGQACTREERGQVEQWLAADPRHQMILDAAVVAAGRTLDAQPLVMSPRIEVTASPRRSPWGLAAAAVFVIAVGGTSMWRVLRPVPAADETAGVLRTTATGRGQRDTLRLDDGTRVVLGAASRLRYPAEFGAGARDVYLVGEGYFEVAHDARRPFRVHTSDATAEDLGTAFDVRAYAEDSVVHVVVAEGKVALAAAIDGRVPEETVLTPGQLGRLRRGSTVPSVRHVDVAAYLDWTRGRLAFDDAPLHDVVAELARWYHADFRIDDSALGDRRLTGTFASQSLPKLLDALSPVLDVRFEHRGDSVIVRRTTRSP